MSDFTAISDTSNTLLTLLRDQITISTDPQLRDVQINLQSPKEMLGDGEMGSGISLWLYRVIRNGHVYNSAPRRVTVNQVLHQPLPIDLYYLITPIAAEPEDEQLLLGKVLQVFNDNNILRGSTLQGSLREDNNELRLTLEMLSLEEITRIWDALKGDYQLSVSYVVQVVTIDSDQESIEISPLIEKENRYTQITSVT